MTDSILRAAALDYARSGADVLPLRPHRKDPACAHGKDDACADVDQIAEWWTAQPDRNIGVRPKLNEFVIDLDTQNGGTKPLSEILDRHGPFPATRCAVTGNGGRHWWFRGTGPFRGKLCEGVDIKGHGGYLVVPPSIHPNGREYVWADTSPIAQAPRWLLPLVKVPTYRPPPPRVVNPDRRTEALLRRVADAGEGSRNAIVYWALCRVVERGEQHLVAEIRAVATAIGLPEREFETCLRSAERTVRRTA